MTHTNSNTPWSIADLLQGNPSLLTDPEFLIAKFWESDPMGNCIPFHKKNAVHHFVVKFLPYFGFHKYRNGNTGNCIIIQQNGKRVRIIGNDYDRQSAIEIFEWFQDQVMYLRSILGEGKDGIPHGFESEVFINVDLFTSKTLSFLPKKSQGESFAPLRDSLDTAFLPFRNGIISINSHDDPKIVPWSDFPENVFVWDKEVIDYDFKFSDQPTGVFWEFLTRLAWEESEGTWKSNPLQQDCITSAIGYLCHNYKIPDQRPCVILYDRSTLYRNGGNGKSRLCEALEYVRPVHEISGKHLKRGDNQFSWSGYTPEKRIALIQDIVPNFEFDSLYNQIEDSFTIEEKGRNKIVIPRDQSPKLIITTNHTVDNQGWSDARRQHLVPIGTFFGTHDRLYGRKIKDIIGKLLYHDWTNSDWIEFYNVIVYCLQSYLSKGLTEFKDVVYQDRQMLESANGNEELLITVKDFIQDAVDNHEGVTNRILLENALDTPELDSINSSWKGTWQTRVFKRVADAMGFQINPGRRNARWQRDYQGQMTDFYELKLKTDTPPMPDNLFVSPPANTMKLIRRIKL